jgi:hypothetical protein
MWLKFVDGLNSINATIWGILILLLSMLLGWQGKTELCYYFAGVGSTLAGINHLKDMSAKIETKDTKVEIPNKVASEVK